jgi:altronate dehydratase large subunit
LTTLEEKALGAVAKTGSRMIQGVLDHAEMPTGQGLWLMDQPWYAPESLSGMTAAGAQIVLFTTGPGNGFTSLLSPTIKISANPKTCARLPEQIDFDASNVFSGKFTPEEAAEALLMLLIEVASGKATFGEILGEGEEVQSRLGASL